MAFHSRLAVSWILGIWLGASAFMILVATRNFRMVEWLIAEPSAGLEQRLQRYGVEEMRALLRYQASELNRFFFSTFEVAELALAVALAALAFTGARSVRLLRAVATLLLVLMAVEHFVLTPEITRIGRAAEFRILAAGTPEYQRFWTYHGAYSALEIVKLVLLAAGTVLTFWRER